MYVCMYVSMCMTYLYTCAYLGKYYVHKHIINKCHFFLSHVRIIGLIPLISK